MIKILCIALKGMAGIAICGFSGAACAGYFGEREVIAIRATGCNAVSYAPVPGDAQLFIGRQFFKLDGSLLTREEGCDTSRPAVEEAIRSSRWGLVLDRLDWAERTMTVIKPLLVPPTQIAGGPMRGATIKSAYDANALIYRGQYWVAFECVLQNPKAYGVKGTSSCLALFDKSKQELRLDKTYVVVSASADDAGRIHHSASVPSLLSFKDHIYLYWSEVTNERGKFVRVGVRGAELELDSKGFLWVRGVGGMAYSMGPGTVEVWGPVADDPLSDTAVDLKSIWATDSSVVALVSLGGSGCTAPRGPQPGCWRMALAKAKEPIGDHVFNDSPLLDVSMLPTNPQDYTRLIANQSGGYSFFGSFYPPIVNGLSETRPAPADRSISGGGRSLVFPFPDETLWPAK